MEIFVEIEAMICKLYRCWVVLMIISGGVALYFFCSALADVWKFVSLSEQVSAQILCLHVKPLPSSRFAIEAEYAYEVDSTPYVGKTTFDSPQFLNRFAAETDLLLMNHRPETAYYTKRNPALSSLENVFPHKRCVLALITLGVFLYFYFSRVLLLKFISHLLRDHDAI